MSTFKVPVVPVVLEKHENADSLSLLRVFGRDGYTAIVKTADFDGETHAAYVHAGYLVPDDGTNFADFRLFKDAKMVASKWLVGAVRLRGIYSEGFAVPARGRAWVEGMDVAEELGVTKFVEPEGSGHFAPPPAGHVPTYRVEHLREYAYLLREGERVLVHEKVDGQNIRLLLDGDTLHVGSHREWEAQRPDSAFWRVVTPGVREFLAHLPRRAVLYGELFGDVRKLKYGAKPGEARLVVFDVYDRSADGFLGYDQLAALVDTHGAKNGVALPPLLYDGPWDPALLHTPSGENDQPGLILALGEGDSRIGGAGHIMEGGVLRVATERFEEDLNGPVRLKLHSARYMLRKKR
jgi:RNA ligase (TIGR02306 family)